MRYDLIIRNGTLVDAGALAHGERSDVGVIAGRFAAFGDLGQAEAAEVIDASGLTVMPGVMDTQVHFREPGLEHKEDLESGTRGAVLGGITAVFEMPNTKPSTTDAAALEDKLARARGRAWCDHAFYLGAAAENADQLGELERLAGCCGVKVFMGSSTGSLLVADDATLARVLAHGKRRVAVHSEDEARLNERKSVIPAEGAHPRLHPVWRDEETALRATRRLIAAARAAKRRVHVLHISTAEELDLLAQNKDICSVECLGHHLTLVAPDCYDRLGSYAQMNPPIRDARHHEALWRAVRDGVVDILGSDHAPHSRAEKDLPYPKSPSGMPGVQTLLPTMLDHVAKGRLSLARLIDLTSAGPVRLFGIANKGRIARGFDADLTIVDLKAQRTITNAWMAAKCGWTPYDGMRVTGWPIMTVIRGQVVMRDDQVVGTARGAVMRFHEAL